MGGHAPRRLRLRTLYARWLVRIAAPALRERREKGGRELDIRLQVVRAGVWTADWNGLRLEESTVVRMDRIPIPPIRVPFRHFFGSGQRERGND